MFLLPAALALVGDRWRPTAVRAVGAVPGRGGAAVQRDDERQFGQVTRALLRAREVNRYGGFADPPASADPWRPNR